MWQRMAEGLNHAPTPQYDTSIGSPYDINYDARI